MATKRKSPNVVSINDFSDRSKPVQSEKPTNRLKLRIDDLRTFRPLTINQDKFFKLYNANKEVIGMFGSAGVGKTFLAVYKALEQVMDKSNPLQKVVIVRSSVQVRDQGFMPGTIQEKQAIFEKPYREICTTLFNRADAYDRLKEQNVIDFITTTDIRGITIDDAVVIVDECQSMNMHELTSIMTRPGNRSKVIFCGDIKQSDLIKTKHDVSGLPNFVEILENMVEYAYVEFTSKDIVRSGIAKSFIIASEKLGY